MKNIDTSKRDEAIQVIEMVDAMMNLGAEYGGVSRALEFASEGITHPKLVELGLSYYSYRAAGKYFPELELAE